MSKEGDVITIQGWNFDEQIGAQGLERQVAERQARAIETKNIDSVFKIGDLVVTRVDGEDKGVPTGIARQGIVALLAQQPIITGAAN